MPEQPKRARMRKFDPPVEYAMRFPVRKASGGIPIHGRGLAGRADDGRAQHNPGETFRWGYVVESRTGDGWGAIAGTIHPSGPLSVAQATDLGAAVRAL